MKAHILIGSSYGFDHNWTLVVSTPKKTKIFYLGQDVKFCGRVLGMTPRNIVSVIGTSEIGEGTRGNIRLAKFICKALGLNGRSIDKIEPWGLSGE